MSEPDMLERGHVIFRQILEHSGNPAGAIKRSIEHSKRPESFEEQLYAFAVYAHQLGYYIDIERVLQSKYGPIFS